jgi:hypothetical protein
VPASPYFEFTGTGMPGIGDDPTIDGLCAGAWGDADGDPRPGRGPDRRRVGRHAHDTRVPQWLRREHTTERADRLSLTVDGLRATFAWNAATDAETPSAGLSYNLRVGTSPGIGDIVPPMALPSGRRILPALGNAMENLSWTIDLPAPARSTGASRRSTAATWARRSRPSSRCA